MRATEYVAMHPLQLVPGGRYVAAGERLEALRDVLRGVDLGEYDVRLLGWLADHDDPTVRTLVSLILRAREAGPYEAAGGQR
jgi:hypothetical protein